MKCLGAWKTPHTHTISRSFCLEQTHTHTQSPIRSVSNTHTHTHTQLYPSFHYKTRGLKRQLFLFYNCIFTFNSIHWSPAVSLESQAWDSLESLHYGLINQHWLNKYTIYYIQTCLWACVVPEALNSFASNEKCSRCLHEEENIINGWARQPAFLFKAASEEKYVTMQWGMQWYCMSNYIYIYKKSRQTLLSKPG